MSAKDVVRERYAQAEALYRKPAHALGQATAYVEGGWVVLSGPYLGAQLLGGGQSEDEAWTDAASQLSARHERRFGSFKEFLAAQAAAEAGELQHKKNIQEWQGDVAELLAQLIKWLSEVEEAKVLTIERGLVHKDEQGLGSYDVAAMRIGLGTKFVELIPIGRNVVGGIGDRGDLGFRAEGRVDMRNSWHKYMLYRINSEGGRSWLMVDDIEYKPRSLTRDTFESILQDLLFMKTLDDAWKWYIDAKKSLFRIRRVRAVWWDRVDWNVKPWLGDKHFVELESREVVEAAENASQNLDDIAVVVLFSLFEATVRGEILKQIEIEERDFEHRTIAEAIKTAKDRVSEGSFYAVLDPFKTSNSDLIEKVHQVRRFRNWVSHGKRGPQPPIVDPKTAYDRLSDCLLLLLPDVPASHITVAAYYIWETETQPHGKAAVHWEKAKVRLQELVRSGHLVV